MSFNGSPSSLFNLTFVSIGVMAGLLPNLPVSFRSSRIYFLWDINKPFDGEVIKYIEDKLSDALYYDKITTDDMADYYNRLQWLGHDKLSLISPSITPDLLKPPPGLMAKKEELFKKYVVSYCTYCKKKENCELHITVDNKVKCTS